MNVAVIGNGYWGKIITPYIKKFFNIKYVANSCFNKNIIWNDTSIEAVFIITPVDTHFSIAKDALLYNKHIFVEKPLTANYKEAVELYNISKKVNKEIVTDYVYTFSKSLLSIQKLLNSKNKLYIKSYQLQNGRYSNHDVFTVLGSHHLSILDMFFDINELNFEFISYKMKNGLCTTGKIKYDFGEILLSLDNKTKYVVVRIECDNLVYGYNPDFGFFVNNKKCIIDEKNNLLYSVLYFYNVITKKCESNIKRSLKITKIIER